MVTIWKKSHILPFFLQFWIFKNESFLISEYLLFMF